MNGSTRRRRAGVKVFMVLAAALVVLAASLVTLSAWTGGASAAAGSGPAPAWGGPEGGHPALSLPAPASGSAALDALGVHLPAVAKAYGLTGAQLAYRLRADGHLVVDRHGYLFYNEAPLEGFGTAGATGAAALSAPVGAAAPAPLEDTFRLHSLPGAQRVVYLDFDGHLLSKCAWTQGYNGGADIVAPPWDIDGDPGSFGDTERTRIQQIWQRVAEDYAPFAVDVTTEYPGEAAITRSSSSDQQYGMRVLISPISSYVGNYGGVAYVGVFDMVGDFYKPALVFPEKLANGEKYIGEAASHENGHTLALYHDGTTTGVEYYQGSGSGETGWAPIMGVGYNKNLTQWSRGEYPNANNTQDDLAVIASRGAPLRADDVGSGAATARVLAGSGPLTAGGLVGPSGDADYFAVTSGDGILTVNVTPAERGPNLDILVELRDAAGALVASGNPLDLLAADLSAPVTQGTYYIVVRGTGRLDPLQAGGYSAYACVGAYTLMATVPGTSGNVAPTAVIGANPTTGDAPVAVTFSGSASYDPDGVITSYAWAFGDGATATGAASSVTHTYTVPGTYNATLTVTDNMGLTSPAAATTITVRPANGLPTARITADKTSGYAPLTVNFSGTGSTDPDGSIVSYGWDFGDGTTGSGATVARTYSTVGTYTVRLTVTDDRGGTGTATQVISVQQDPAKVLKVASVTVAWVKVTGGYQAKATVKIVDGYGNLVGGAKVTGTFSGLVAGTASGTTGTSGTTLGIASILSKKVKSSGSTTFTVTSVTKTGYVFQPGPGM